MGRMARDEYRRNVATAWREFREGRITRREFVRWSAIWGGVVAGLAGVEPRATAAGEVNYFAWGGYQDTKLAAEFKAKKGITLNPLVFRSNEECFLKVKQSGGATYDVFVADAWWPRQHHEAGTVEPLDLSAFTTAKTLNPMFRNFRTLSLDDGKVVGVPYHWDYSTVVYREDRLAEAPDSMGVLFDSNHRGRVVWRDRATEMIGLMAMVMGLPLERPEYPRQWHLEPAELKRVKDELVKAKRQMQPLWYGSNTEAVKMFAGNEVDLGYNASFVVHELVRVKGPRVRAATRLRSPERLFGYVDAVCLVKGAAHREEALQFIDWVTSLEGRRILFERNGYPDTDQALIDWAVGAGYRDLLEARGVLRPEAVVPTMVMFAPPTDLQAWVEAFNEVKAA